MPEAQYRILIEALLQLRRPQLSKQLDTKELSRILTASLPSLDTRVIRPLAEGFERLDHHRDERADWQRTLEATRAFLHVYRDYVAAVGKARAQDLTHADSAFQSARAAVRQAQREHETALGEQ